MSTEEQGNDGNEEQAAPTFSELLKGKSLDDIFAENKDLKSEYDRKVSKGIESYKAANPSKKEDEPKKEDEEKVPAWAKDFKKQMENFQSFISSSKKEEGVRSIFEGNKKLEGIPDALKNGYLKRLKSADDIEAEIKEIESEVEAIKKTYVKEDKGLPAGGGTSKGKAATKEEAAKIFGRN